MRAIHCSEHKPPHAHMLLEDLILLWEHNQDLNMLPSPAVAPAQWAKYIVASRARWKRQVQAIAHLPDRVGFLAQQAAPPTDAEITEAAQGQGSTDKAEQLLQCELCGKWCRGWRGKAAHKFRAHHVVATARAYCLTSCCPACGKDLGSRPRAIHHLQYSAKHCRALLLQGCLQECKPAEVEAADLADRELVRGYVLAGRGRLVARLKGH